MNRRIRNMIIAALMLALSWLMPFLAAMNPVFLKKVSPMHIPIFLCGFICDMPWALIVGFIAPLLRSFTTGIPVLYPNAVAMAFELMTYGGVTTFLSRHLKWNTRNIYITLISSMLIGRLVWGAVSFVLYGLSGSSFTFQMFLAGAFTNAVPGIIFHILVIPPIVIALQKAKVIKPNQFRTGSKA